MNRELCLFIRLREVSHELLRIKKNNVRICGILKIALAFLVMLHRKCQGGDIVRRCMGNQLELPGKSA